MADIFPLPDRLARLAAGIKTDLAVASTSTTAWVEAMVAAAIKIAEARGAHRDDISFGQWWNAHGLGLNAHDRAALAAMGRRPEEMRKALSITKSRSIQLIYQEHKDRFANASKPPSRKAKGSKKQTSTVHKTNSNARMVQCRNWVLHRFEAGEKAGRGLAVKAGFSEKEAQLGIAQAQAIWHDRQSRKPPALLSDEERREAELQEARRIAAQREANKEAQLAARNSRKTKLQTLTPPEKPVVMFDQQVWPIPVGSHANYTYDQLFFASHYFFGWHSLLHHHPNRRDAALHMQVFLKFLHMFIDRRFSPGDEKSEMGGFIAVFEMLCGLYQDNLDGTFDKPHDECINREY